MLTVVIQAGGESSRMGANKALIPFLGEPLITRVLKRVAPLADELLVTTNHPEKLKFLEVPLVEDVMLGQGALGGIYTALCVAKYPLVAVVGCDMPFINPDILAVERDLLIAANWDAIIPSSDEGMEPFHAIYRQETCTPAVKVSLEAGNKKVTSWLSKMQVYVMEPDEVSMYDPGFELFINVNTPEEFRKAEEIADRQES